MFHPWILYTQIKYRIWHFQVKILLSVSPFKGPQEHPDATLRESGNRINYFHPTLREMHNRKMIVTGIK
jgi:hypothetical protein